MLTTPKAVEARDGYKIWIRFSDGEEGEIDLTHLSGDAWGNRSLFENVWTTPCKLQDERLRDVPTE